MQEKNLPYPIPLCAGKTYFWCACGRSATQPLCDGSHKRSGLEPLAYKSPLDLTVAFCGCKQTRNPPFCDGSHTHCTTES
jgi:CDGSH-type Zn-finger protein